MKTRCSADDPQVARVLLDKVRLERTRQFGSCWLGLELWKRLELDRFFADALDSDAADVPWSRIANGAGDQSAVHAGQRTGDRATLVSVHGVG